LGQHDEAAALAARINQDYPGFTAKNWNFLDLIRDGGVRDTVAGLMRAAGVNAA